MRVALVTGVNTWDIHGSLTYYFDRNQQAQRISFHGWTGDPRQLIRGLQQQFGFQEEPSQWAGRYVARNNRIFGDSQYGGLLLKHPAVIQQNEPTRKVAILLEINYPNGSLEMSREFKQMQEQATR